MAIITKGNNFLYLLEDLKTKDNNTKEAHYNKANRLLNSGEYKQANEEYINALEIDPNFDIALSNKAVSEILSSDYGTAITTYLKMFDILKENPENLKYNIALNNLGVTFILSGKYEQSVKLFNELISLNPADELAYLHRGNALLELREYDEAMNSFDNVISINDKNVIAFFIKGNIHFWKEEYDEAVESYNKAIQLNHNFAEAYRNKSKSLTSLKKYEEAFQCLDEALEKNPERRDLLLDKANIYLLLEKFEDAEKYYDMIIDKEPTNKEVLNYKVVALFKQGKYEETLQTIQDILQIDPNDKDAIERKKLIENLLEKQEERQDKSNQPVKSKTSKDQPSTNLSDIEELTKIQAENRYNGQWVAFKKNNLKEYADDTMGKVIVADKDYKSFCKKVEKANVNSLYCFFAGNRNDT